MCISASRGWGDAAGAPRPAVRHRWRESNVSPSGGSFSFVVVTSPAGLPPLTDSPGQCQAYERKRAGSLCEANTAARSRQETWCSRLGDDAMGLRQQVPQVRDLRHDGCFLGKRARKNARTRQGELKANFYARPRGSRDCRFRRSDLKGRVTSAAPFYPSMGEEKDP